MKILRKKAVIAKTGYSGPHIDRLEKAGKFPRRLHLGEAAIGWLESEVDDWIMQKVRQRDEGATDE